MCKCSETGLWHKCGWILFVLHGLGFVTVGTLLVISSLSCYYCLFYFDFMWDDTDYLFPFGNLSGGVTGVFAIAAGIVACVIICNRNLSRDSCVIRTVFAMSIIGFIFSFWSMAWNLIVIYLDGDTVTDASFFRERQILTRLMKIYDRDVYNSLIKMHKFSTKLNIGYSILQGML